MAAVKFLDANGLEVVRDWVLNEIDTDITGKIVYSITDASTNAQIPGAQAVFDFVTDEIAALVNLRLEIVSTLPAAPETNVVYLIPVAGQSGRYSMHSWISGAWANLGYFEVDLTNYWSKDELVALTNAEIDAILSGV